MTTTRAKWHFTKQEISWILYDVGNSAFVLVIVTAIMPIFFKDVLAGSLSDTQSTALWGYANAAASLILALCAPLLGTFSDFESTRKKVFTILLMGGLLFTFLLATTGQGEWQIALLFFVFARICWAGANVVYDSFLVEVASTGRIDQLSAQGFGWGYIGSVIPFLLGMWLIFSAMSGSESDLLPIHETQLTFIVVAVWWLLFSLPLLKNVRQNNYIPKPRYPLKSAFLQIWQTLKKIRQHRPAFMFLVAYFFYIDGVDTIISMAAVYGRDLDFSATQLISVILFIQIIAFPCALIYSRLAGVVSTKKLLLSGIFVYCIITVLGWALPSVPEARQTTVFWLMAFLVASSMGGIQALSRSYYGKLIPPENSGEFFGFYNIIGKFAAIVGPLMVGLIGTMTGHTRWGVLSLLVLFTIGGWLLWRFDHGPEASSKPRGL